MNYIFLIFALFAGSIYAKDKNELRVISLSPSLTELMFQLGEGKKLVGRSSAGDYPKEVKNIPVVGGFGKPSLEKILGLKPNIVIASTLVEPAIETNLQQFGIKLYLLPTKSINDYYQAVKTVGELLGCELKAKKEIERVKKGLELFKKRNLKVVKSCPKVYIEIWNHPYMTAGNKSFINDMIMYAGGKNIADNQNYEYFNCSVEWIISSNPDIIISPAMKKGGVANIKKRDGWQNIKAVRSNRIYTNLNEDLIYRLGPRVLEGVELLQQIINNKAK